MHTLLPEPVRRLAAWCAVILLVAGVGAVGLWLVGTFRIAVTPVLLALLGTALLGPLYRRLVAMKVHRSLAAGLTCVAVLCVVGGATYVIVRALIDNGPQILTSLRDAFQTFTRHLGAGTALGDMVANAKDLIAKFGGTAASGVLSGLSLVGEGIATAILALLLIFFFLRDSDRAASLAHTVAPGRGGQMVEEMGRRAFTAVEGFMRGTTFIALIDAVLITVGLLILRVPGAFGLGALVFVGAYIPYLGAFISGAVAVLVALADRGWVIALWALGVVLAVQLLEGHVLQPMIQSRTVQMHPAVVMLAITAGAGVAGILGMLLAVPVVAAAFGVIGVLRERYADPSTGPPTAAGDGTPP